MQALLPDLDLDPLLPEGHPGPPASPLKRNLALLVQIAGLLAGCGMLAVAGMRNPAARFTWAGLAGHALRYTFLTWGWSATVTFLLYFTVPSEERRDVAWNTLRVSSAAVWFAPAILLLSDWSPSTLAAGLVLTLTATRMLYSEWRVMHPRPEAEFAPALESLFGDHYLPERVPLRELAPALVSACLLQLGAVEIGIQRRFPAAALVVAGTSLVAIQAVSRGAWSERRPASLPRSFFGAFLTILLAASLTFTGLRGHLVPGGSPAGIGELLRQLIGLDHPVGGGGEADREAGKPGGGDADKPRQEEATPPEQAFGGTFPGVILRPEVQPVVSLIAPLPAIRNGRLSTASRNPFSIRFGGEYWMYRWLTFGNRPPANSFRQSGAPTEFAFRTVDGWPLQMEARQKLIQPIDLACCAAVQIGIRNAETTAAGVQLELVVMGDRRQQSLGMAPVLSRPDASKDPVVPVPETLTFAVPPSLSIGLAQEFQVVFRRVRAQAGRSAKIAIDRFLLVPR